MTCTTEKRERVRSAAERVGARPDCAGVDVLAPGTGPHGAWALEATLTTAACPPAVLRALADASLTLKSAVPRGRGFHVVATV